MNTFKVYVERPLESMFSNGEKVELLAEFDEGTEAQDYILSRFRYDQKFYNGAIEFAETAEIADKLQEIWNATNYFLVEE